MRRQPLPRWSNSAGRGTSVIVRTSNTISGAVEASVLVHYRAAWQDSRTKGVPRRSRSFFGLTYGHGCRETNGQGALGPAGDIYIYIYIL